MEMLKRATGVIFTVLYRKDGVTPGKGGGRRQLQRQLGHSSWELQLVFKITEA